MRQLTVNDQEIVDKGQKKINVGRVIIILSPLLGSLLFWVYGNLLGFMFSGMNVTDGLVEMLWGSCILAMAILGIATVLIGCNKKSIEHKNKINE